MMSKYRYTTEQNRVMMKKRNDEKIAIQLKNHVLMKKTRYDETVTWVVRVTTKKSRYDEKVA